MKDKSGLYVGTQAQIEQWLAWSGRKDHPEGDVLDVDAYLHEGAQPPQPFEAYQWIVFWRDEDGAGEAVWLRETMRLPGVEKTAPRFPIDEARALDAARAMSEEAAVTAPKLRHEYLTEERRKWHKADILGRQQAQAEVLAEERAEAEPGERFVSFDEAFWDQPPATFIVPELLIAGQVGVVYAAGGVGKSLLSQDVVVGLSHRGRVFGEPVEVVPTLYIDEEGSARGLAKRLTSMGLEGEKLENLHYSLLAGWTPLDTPEGGAELVAEVVRTGARLVVLDTVSKLIGGEENGNDTWSRIHRHAMIPLRRRGVSVIHIDHSGKDVRKGQRGGSAKQNNVDCVWLLEVAGNAVKLTNEKDREGDYAAVVYLERNTEPVLEHVRASASVSAAFERYLEFETAVSDCITTLDGLSVPRTASERVATKDLKDAGYEEFKRVVIREAVKRRKPTLGELGTGDSDGADDD
jgi:hypothetical protein